MVNNVEGSVSPEHPSPLETLLETVSTLQAQKLLPAGLRVPRVITPQMSKEQLIDLFSRCLALCSCTQAGHVARQLLNAHVEVMMRVGGFEHLADALDTILDDPGNAVTEFVSCQQCGPLFHCIPLAFIDAWSALNWLKLSPMESAWRDAIATFSKSYGSELAFRRRTMEALPFLRCAAVFRRRDFEAWYNAAVCAMCNKQYDYALEFIDTAIEIDCTKSWAHSTRGHILLKSNHKTAALSFQEALRRDSTNHTAHLGLASIHLSQGDHLQAMKSLQAALALAPQSAATFFDIAQLCFDRPAEFSPTIAFDAFRKHAQAVISILGDKTNEIRFLSSTAETINRDGCGVAFLFATTWCRSQCADVSGRQNLLLSWIDATEEICGKHAAQFDNRTCARIILRIIALRIHVLRQLAPVGPHRLSAEMAARCHRSLSAVKRAARGDQELLDAAENVELRMNFPSDKEFGEAVLATQDSWFRTIADIEDRTAVYSARQRMQLYLQLHLGRYWRCDPNERDTIRDQIFALLELLKGRLLLAQVARGHADAYTALSSQLRVAVRRVPLSTDDVQAALRDLGPNHVAVSIMHLQEPFALTPDIICALWISPEGVELRVEPNADTLSRTLKAVSHYIHEAHAAATGRESERQIRLKALIKDITELFADDLMEQVPAATADVGEVLIRHLTMLARRRLETLLPPGMCRRKNLWISWDEAVCNILPAFLLGRGSCEGDEPNTVILCPVFTLRGKVSAPPSERVAVIYCDAETDWSECKREQTISERGLRTSRHLIDVRSESQIHGKIDQLSQLLHQLDSAMAVHSVGHFDIGKWLAPESSSPALVTVARFVIGRRWQVSASLWFAESCQATRVKDVDGTLLSLWAALLFAGVGSVICSPFELYPRRPWSAELVEEFYKRRPLSEPTSLYQCLDKVGAELRSRASTRGISTLCWPYQVVSLLPGRDR